MDPETVSGQKVRNLGDRERSACALNPDFHFGANEVECGVVGTGRAREQRERQTSECQCLKTQRPSNRSREAHYFPFNNVVDGLKRNFN